jgi:hypothetical protein
MFCNVLGFICANGYFQIPGLAAVRLSIVEVVVSSELDIQSGRGHLDEKGEM